MRDVKLALKVKECKQEYAQLESTKELFEISKLFDGEEIGGEVEEDEEVNAKELLEALQSKENIPIKILLEEPPKESSIVLESNCPRRQQR